MDALRDRSWMPYVFTSVPAERFDRGRCSVVSVSSSPTSARHNERYRYRMFFFQAKRREPVLSVDMESDILGGWRVTVTTSAAQRIAARFDEPPGYEAWKELALGLADGELREADSAGPERGRKGRGKRSPAPRQPN